MFMETAAIYHDHMQHPDFIDYDDRKADILTPYGRMMIKEFKALIGIISFTVFIIIWI